MENILEGGLDFAPSFTICLEDSIRREEIPAGLGNIKAFLERLKKLEKRPLIFLRPPDPEILRQLLEMDLGGVAGFTLPKFRKKDHGAWCAALGDAPFAVMPTLETEEVFEASSMRALAYSLETGPLHGRVLLLRIGGNDLQRLLGTRLGPGQTIYDGALGCTLGMLAALFIPRGFNLAAPVFNDLEDEGTLLRELARDLAHGFCGKSAVHPAQMKTISQALAASPADLELAERVLAAAGPVFRHGGAMCEPATQSRWAQSILARQKVFGTGTALKKNLVC